MNCFLAMSCSWVRPGSESNMKGSDLFSTIVVIQVNNRVRKVSLGSLGYGVVTLEASGLDGSKIFS